MKKVFSWLLIAAVGLGASLLSRELMHGSLSYDLRGRTGQIDKIYDGVTDESRRFEPKRINEYITMSNMAIDENLNLVYTYRVDENVYFNDEQTWREQTDIRLYQSTCRYPLFQEILELNGSITHTYVFTGGDETFRYTSLEDCPPIPNDMVQVTEKGSPSK